MEGDAVAKARISSRPRRGSACDACRRNKQKCEMIFPCKRCVRRGMPCEDPLASEEDEWMAKQLSVRHGLDRWLKGGTPDTLADEAQRQRSRPRRISRDKATMILMVVLDVYRSLALEAHLAMLQAWSKGLKEDLAKLRRKLDDAKKAAISLDDALTSPQDGGLHLDVPINDDEPIRLLHPYLKELFVDAYISLCSVYRAGEARVFGNQNWCRSMHSEQVLHNKLHVEKHPPEAIFASVMKPRERDHFASVLDHCLFASEDSRSEVVQVMEGVHPPTGNPFMSLMRLRVVAQDGYMGITMALQILPCPISLEPKALYRSSFMSGEKIMDGLVSAPSSEPPVNKKTKAGKRKRVASKATESSAPEPPPLLLSGDFKTDQPMEGGLYAFENKASPAERDLLADVTVQNRLLGDLDDYDWNDLDGFPLLPFSRPGQNPFGADVEGLSSLVPSGELPSLSGNNIEQQQPSPSLHIRTAVSPVYGGPSQHAIVQQQPIHTAAASTALPGMPRSSQWRSIGSSRTSPPTITVAPEHMRQQAAVAAGGQEGRISEPPEEGSCTGQSGDATDKFFSSPTTAASHKVEGNDCCLSPWLVPAAIGGGATGAQADVANQDDHCHQYLLINDHYIVGGSR